VVELSSTWGRATKPSPSLILTLTQRGLSLSIDIVYFSNHSGNTKRFVERVDDGTFNIHRIPIDFGTNSSDFIAPAPYVLFVPSYGGGSERSAIPRQVRRFLNVLENRDLLRGVVGLGNRNFGNHFCKAAELISAKTGVPVIAKIEIFGTEEDVYKVKERLQLLYGTEI
jgi:protein involved in ribonucleotide reduction